MTKITFSPVTRISGLLSIDIFVDSSGTVTEANCIGEQFRGFELIMQGRKITDAPYLTQRICGICSMAHGYTAARLVSQIFDVPLTPESILLQQAMLGAEFLQNHIRHFYLLALPDYLRGTDLPMNTSFDMDTRFNSAQERKLTEHYFSAMEASQKCHAMLAIFGGKIPHQHGLVPEGVTAAPTAETRLQFISLLHEVQEFITYVMLPDTYLLSEVYSDYYATGIRPPTFISFGLFDPRFGGYFPAGIYDGEKTIPVNNQEIHESITFSWYQNMDSQVLPAPDKPNAYSWVKAPRYRGLPLEGGPFARKFIRQPGAVQSPPNTMDRIVARSEETALIAGWIAEWLAELPASGTYVTSFEKPVRSEAVQQSDAPRGALLHGAKVSGDDVITYSVITPTAWNLSPKDDNGRRGPAEEALVGTAVSNPEKPFEIGRIIRAFDPCLNCATHVIQLNSPRETKG